MIEIENSHLLEDFLNTTNVVLVIFYANWCLPCKKILENLAVVNEEFQTGIVILNIDVEKHLHFTLQKNVSIIPSIHYFKNGKLYLQESGLKTNEFLKNNIEKLIALEEI